MACSHPTMMGNICCDCGIILEEDNDDLFQPGLTRQTSTNQASIAMLHSIPELRVSKKVDFKNVLS